MIECPQCESEDVDVAPALSGNEFECNECGHQFDVDYDYPEPSDEQKMRAYDLTSRFWKGDWSTIGLGVSMLLLIAVATYWALTMPNSLI